MQTFPKLASDGSSFWNWSSEKQLLLPPLRSTSPRWPPARSRYVQCSLDRVGVRDKFVDGRYAPRFALFDK